MQKMLRKRLVRAATDQTKNLIERLPTVAQGRVKRAIATGPIRNLISIISGEQYRLNNPLVTIVVPIYNVAQYLPEFLDSVVKQTYENLEILIVDDGSPDESAEIARNWARRDHRIKVISKTNGGLGDARNTGLKIARGKYITFTDSDDVLPPDSIRAMVTTIESTGSDFVVGAMARMQGGKIWLPQWTRRVHGLNRYGISIEQYPEILLDVFACNKIWDITFFREHVGGFPVGISYEDQEPSVKSYINAEKFDIIKDQVYFWRIRDDGSSITQQKAKLSDLRDRAKVSLAVAGHISQNPHDAVRREWYRKIFGTDLIQYVEQVPRTGREYFDELCDAYEAIVNMCEKDFWKDVATYPSVATWYILRRDYDSLLDIIAGHTERGRGYHLIRDGGALLSKPAYLEGLRNQPPREVYEIRENYLDVISKVTRLEWLDEYRVKIAGYAFVRSAFSKDENVKISMAIASLTSGKQHPLPTENVVDPSINEISATEVRDCSTSGFETVIDTSQINSIVSLSGETSGVEQWVLCASVEFENIRRQDIVRDIDDGTGAAYLGHSGLQEQNQVLALTHDSQSGLSFRRARPKVVAGNIELTNNVLNISVKSLRGEQVTKLVVRAKRGKDKLIVDAVRTDDAGYTYFNVVIPPRRSHSTRVQWNVSVLTTDGTKRLIHSGGGSTSELNLLADHSALSADFDSRGYFRIDDWPRRFTAESVVVEDNYLVATGHFLMDDENCQPELTLAGQSLSIRPYEFQWDRESSVYVARFQLTRTDWYGVEVALPLDAYGLRGRILDGSGTAVSRWIQPFLPLRLASTLPWEGATAYSRIKITRTRVAFRPWIKVLPLLEPKERGMFNRRLEITESIDESSRGRLHDSVVFESYHGKQISDSCRAIFEWVRYHRPDVTVYWSINSHAVSVPEGAIAIVQGTRDWLRAVNSSRYLINNSNFPGYFRIREGQRYLQTWHGTPMKKIAEDMPPGNLSLGYRLLMRRESKAWEVLLAQNSFAARVLPEAFWFHGETLEVGYPRNDLLSGSKGVYARTYTRERLGISDDSFVVLYAPTFRDNVRSSGGGYSFTSELDVERLLAGLPEDAVVLVRGHVNTSGATKYEGIDRVIDVSSYGEISELFAASDVLISDYSSMMFDYGVTRKPMLFFVPDLDTYESSTRGFYLNFRDICPGPMHKLTESLVDDLQRALVDPDSFVDSKYSNFVERFAPHDDGNATIRTIGRLKSLGWDVFSTNS